MAKARQRLPSAGPSRESLRAKGQFWTPPWIAEAMVAYALSGGADALFDPAVGAGAFFRAARKVAQEIGRSVSVSGMEVDPNALREADRDSLSSADLEHVRVADFLHDPPVAGFKAIVANPPYIRHHRLTLRTKALLKGIGHAAIGTPLDGRAGLHVYFLVRALQLLDKGGRLAFILPADSVEGVFAPALWRWICSQYRLDTVVTFASEASPFPGVDTNPLIVMIQNAPPRDDLVWARCNEAGTDELRAWVLSGSPGSSGGALMVHRRNLAEALATGLSRPPRAQDIGTATLGEFAEVLRGIATGANGFFHLTRARAEELGLPDDLLLPAVGRTRDVLGDEITAETLAALDRSGRPTLLFSPDGRPARLFPPTVQAYLRHGEALGIASRTLVATRRPWHKMETRRVPPILFAYLGRRNARFIRNRAGVVPLTGFLCVYPRHEHPEYVDRLWRVLRHPLTTANLPWVGKSYGGGAVKVEPRALEMLPLPASLLRHSGLRKPASPQLPLPG